MATRKHAAANLIWGFIVAAALAIAGTPLLASECCADCPPGCQVDQVCCGSGSCPLGNFNCGVEPSVCWATCDDLPGMLHDCSMYGC